MYFGGAKQEYLSGFGGNQNFNNENLGKLKKNQ